MVYLLILVLFSSIIANFFKKILTKSEYLTRKIIFSINNKVI